MRKFFSIMVLICSAASFSGTAYAQSRHVILISIDGFRPAMYLDKNWPTPNLQILMKQGTYVDHNLSVFPAYTHPAHAAMITGSMPARSKITYNQPVNDRSGNWNWYYKQIKVPTIFEALKKAGMTTAAVMWPNTVDGDINWNVSEIWDKDHPSDRATVVRQHARPIGIYEELEQNATGKLDSTSQNDELFTLDENTGRMAAYIFKKYKPNLMALHFACVDGAEHEYGLNADSVRLAVAANDRAIGGILQAIQQSGLKDSTTILITGDHGFSDYHQVMRPNRLIKNVPATFIAAGGSCFLYRYSNTKSTDEASIIKAVTDSLNYLPKDIRSLFRIVDRKELDKMGADSSALLALTAVPGTVFSGSTGAAQTVNHGPGTLIQQLQYEGLIVPSTGGHHGYDPNIPEMWTGFIAAGAGIKKGGHIPEMRVVDISPLIAKLLNIDFKTPDSRFPQDIIIK
ncbi:alkaline phosphatase family protein [Mucilaginibacter ximonensis]|uniref:Alkaline phosphatase family protein n=1 Tax=Mucilaginibacter ximonensis TaxID=538021 RepID=A0ABW5YAK1_9SPHI